MELYYYKTLDSTQSFLKEAIKEKRLKAPVCVVADAQSAGMGSRGNAWFSQEGNLFFSFALNEADFPEDLPSSSIAIYVSFLLKMVLQEHGSKVWIKWPNDFYLGDKKLGGTISNKIGQTYICGMGLNTKKAVLEYARLDIEIQRETLLEEYINLLQKKLPWKMVLKKFEVEFELSKHFHTHDKHKIISLKEAVLCEDGSIMIDKRRIYSLR